MPDDLLFRRRQLAFVERLQAAEQHWFFVQGLQAAQAELFVPAVSSFLNGLEATLRIYVHRYSQEPFDWVYEPSPYRVMSNKLIKQATDLGLRTELLRFPDELDFQKNLESQKPNKIDVKVVQLRNDLCHGNIGKFARQTLDGEVLFVPELLSDVSEQLLTISEAWAEELQSFRVQKEAR